MKNCKRSQLDTVHATIHPNWQNASKYNNTPSFEAGWPDVSQPGKKRVKCRHLNGHSFEISIDTQSTLDTLVNI